jgi:hypothetical protein
LRRYATSWKVADSSIEVVNEIFNLFNLSSRTQSLAFSQSLTEVPEDIYEGNEERCVRSPSMSRLSRNCRFLNISHNYRIVRPVTRIALLYFYIIVFLKDYRMKNCVYLMYSGRDTVGNLSISAQRPLVCVSVVYDL